MSSSERTQQRQIYYQQPTHNQQTIQRIGTSSLMDPHHREHQIVVVSGNNPNQCNNCDFHPPTCDCPNCDSKMIQGIGDTLMDQRNELYSYSIPMEHSNDDDEDGIVHEFTTQRGERHVVIMTKSDTQTQQQQHAQEGLSMQERMRRQKLSEAARNRYALLSEEEKRAVTERRIVMRQRRKQKEREMEELEAILRATNDITDDLVPIDEASLQRKRAKISRYQSMSIEERREYNQKRRLKQLGLPENIDEVAPEKLNQIKKHISEVNARKAEAARQRYHRMNPAERKAYNRRRNESFRKRRVEEEKLLSTPAGQITPEALEKAQSIMLRNAKRAEQARLRYQRKQQEKGIVPRRQRKPKAETTRSDSAEPNLDQILDSIERDVVRKTEEAKQALKKRQQIEIKKDEDNETGEHRFIAPADVITGAPGTHLIQSPINVQQQVAGQNIVQYVQVPSQNVQNGFIIADNKFVQVHTDVAHQPSQQSYIIQEASGANGSPTTSYYPVSIIQHDSPHRQPATTSVAHHHLGSQPTRIEIVQPTIITSHGNFDHLTAVPTSAGRVVHYAQQPQHSSNQQQQQPYAIQIEHPPSRRQLPSSSSSRRISIDPNLSPVDQKLLLQKAKRAERARRRYHEMSAEARHEFNAKRAHALKMARLRDEELCRIGDELSLKGEEPDENLRMEIEQARMRRAKRAEAARIKYQKMTSEQRKAHNAMRDAQRRQRKRELEDTVVVKHE